MSSEMRRLRMVNCTAARTTRVRPDGRLSAGVVANYPLGHTARLVEDSTLDRYQECGVDHFGSFFEGLERNAGTNLGPGANRRREPHSIQSVVDRHADAAHLNRLSDQIAQQRERQKAMRNRCAVR